jgi:hypothetical protein
MISRHVIFDEACFPFAASPHLTNDYEFLSEMDLVLSPIRTCLNVGTPMTMANDLTVHSGSLTALVVEAGGLTATPGGSTASPTSDSAAPPDGLTAPPGGLITRVAEDGG